VVSFACALRVASRNPVTAFISLCTASLPPPIIRAVSARSTIVNTTSGRPSDGIAAKMSRVHVWDSVTPAEELLETMSQVIRAGKAPLGLSNSPVWYVSKVATLAIASGRAAPIALQYFYSLVNREIEEECMPLATDFGMALQSWSPLAFGLLTGKCDRSAVEAAGPRECGLPREAAQPGTERPGDDKRLDGANPFGDSLFTERNWVDRRRCAAGGAGLRGIGGVALAWVIQRPGVASTLMGVSKVEQARDNIAALDLHLSAAHLAVLDEASAPVKKMLYSLFMPALRQHAVFGGSPVRSWAEQAKPRSCAT